MSDSLGISSWRMSYNKRLQQIHSASKPSRRPYERAAGFEIEGQTKSGASLSDIKWNDYLSAIKSWTWLVWVAIAIVSAMVIVGVLFIIFWALKLFMFAPKDHRLLSVDLTAPCLADDVDTSPQHLALTYYNINYCVSTSCGYSAWLVAFTSSIDGCGGVYNGPITLNRNPTPGLIYSKPDLSRIQDMTRSFSVSFWYNSAAINSRYDKSIICGFDTESIPAIAQNNLIINVDSLTWRIGISFGYFWWQFSGYGNLDFYNPTRILYTSNVDNHIIFQWDASIETGYFYLNGVLQTTFAPTGRVVLVHGVTYFNIGCGFQATGLLSYLKIYDGLPSIASLYDPTLACNSYTVIANPTTCPAPDANLIILGGELGEDLNGGTGSISNFSSTGG